MEPDDLEQLERECTSRYLERTWPFAYLAVCVLGLRTLLRGPGTEEQPWSPSSPEPDPWTRLE